MDTKQEFELLKNKIMLLENESTVSKEALDKLANSVENLDEQVDVLGPIINDLMCIETEEENENYHLITKYLPCKHGKIGCG